MATSLLQTTRFKVIFGICWFSLAEVQAIVLNQLGFSWQNAFVDSLVSYVVLGVIVLILSTTLQFYLPVRNRYGYLAALVTIFTLLWIFISRTILLLVINDTPGYANFFTTSFTIRLVFGLLIIGCTALITVIWYSLQDQQEIGKRKAEAEQLSKEAELYNLRQQLQPHFLFNSLNSINALIKSDPGLARTMILQLSEFLRGTLKKEEQQWVSLHEELQQLHLYLQIEKVRFGHRLSTDITNKIGEAEAKMPSMLLQPIVENAIKFGLYDTTDEITISVNITMQNNLLRVSVSNPFDAETSSPKKGVGFGLNAVQRRLELLYARKDLLQTSAKENIFTTTVIIPQTP